MYIHVHTIPSVVVVVVVVGEMEVLVVEVEGLDVVVAPVERNESRWK